MGNGWTVGLNKSTWIKKSWAPGVAFRLSISYKWKFGVPPFGQLTFGTAPNVWVSPIRYELRLIRWVSLLPPLGLKYAYPPMSPPPLVSLLSFLIVVCLVCCRHVGTFSMSCYATSWPLLWFFFFLFAIDASCRDSPPMMEALRVNIIAWTCGE